ncbi:dTMP kinase [Bacteroidota bacterium]
MFISFEGIDFCGKSTQVDLLKKYLVDNKKTVKVIREPGGTEISEKIRKLLLDKDNQGMLMETEFLLFSSSRAQLVGEKIQPYLERGIYVISDRFHDSSTAYQGYGRGIPVEIVKNIHKLAIGDTLPNITFFIDIPVETAENRRILKEINQLDRIEKSNRDFYNRVRNGYLTMAENEKRFNVIDGTKSIEVIHNKIVEEIGKIDER